VNANDQVFPIQGYQNPNGFEGPSGGTDLRAYIATAALQGYLAGRNKMEFPGYEQHHQQVAVNCLKYADALITELNQKEGV